MVYTYKNVEVHGIVINVPCVQINGECEEVYQTRGTIMETLRNRLLAGDVQVIDSIVNQYDEWLSNEDLDELLNI